MSSTRRNIAVIGLGTFGKSVARELTRIGDRVLGIDSDPAKVADLADELDACLEADTTDIKALAQCGLEDFDTVMVAIGRGIEASVLTAVNLRELGITQVWVKAQSARHETVLRAIGIDRVVQPERAYGIRTAQKLHNPFVTDFLAFPGHGYIVQMDVPHVLVGQTPDGLGLRKRFGVKCVGIYRDGDVIINGCEALEMEPGDNMLIYGSRKDLRRFADSL